MQKGKDFEVSKDVYDRARAQYKGTAPRKSYYMAKEDENRLFSDSIIWGYGLYNCQVREENGKYMCSWEMGDTCD
jgi:hypothetical protein